MRIINKTKLLFHEIRSEGAEECSIQGSYLLEENENIIHFVISLTTYGLVRCNFDAQNLDSYVKLPHVGDFIEVSIPTSKELKIIKELIEQMPKDLIREEFKRTLYEYAAFKNENE